MKPYQRIPILECGEPLLPILESEFASEFALEQPHPYIALGAPYGDKSPYFLRQGVLERLHQAQTVLQTLKPGWKVQIFDAYRPIAVQQFIVDYTFNTTLAERGLTIAQLTETEQAKIWDEVYQFWATPSFDPATPPPHSTGAAIDVTLVDEAGQTIEMGSAIDELSPRSYPDHFADSAIWHPLNPEVTSEAAQNFHTNRQLLQQVMQSAGFLQHPNEWWHFSWGDQFWAWQMRQIDSGRSWTARYGRA
jgi:D-alanyl-D-alanine dipeptidase